jgi:hypothetical protein
MEAPQRIAKEGHEARGGECGVNDVLNFLESKRDAIKFLIVMARWRNILLNSIMRSF